MSRKLGYASLGMLGLVGMLMAFPTCKTGADAITNNTRQAEAGVSVDAAASLAMSLGTAAAMDIDTISDTGAFAYGEVELKVSTNNPAGYAVYMQTADGSTTMNSTDLSNAEVINSITAAMPGSSFTGNTWGYALGATGSMNEQTTYNPIPTNANAAIHTTNTLTTGDTYALGFGVHIDKSLPAGAYSNTVIVSTVANPKTIASLSDLSFMQDMTSSVCANTREGTEKQLIDARDGQKYYVAKLKDGHCWMVQNLALSLTAEGLTSELSDIGPTYDVTTPYEEVEENGKTVWKWNENSVIKPKATCAAGDLSDECNSWESGSTTENTEDPHMAIGNYYSWSVAVAGSQWGSKWVDEEDDNEHLPAGYTAEASICPKGWRLATPFVFEQELFDSYGINNAIIGTMDGVNYSLLQKPLYFVLGGYVDTSSTRNDQYSLKDVGSGGYYWTGDTGSGIWYEGVSLKISPSGIGNDHSKTLLMSDDGRSGNGYNVRCYAW